MRVLLTKVHCGQLIQYFQLSPGIYVGPARGVLGIRDRTIAFCWLAEVDNPWDLLDSHYGSAGMWLCVLGDLCHSTGDYLYPRRAHLAHLTRLGSHVCARAIGCAYNAEWESGRSRFLQPPPRPT